MKEYMQIIHNVKEFHDATNNTMSIFVFSANWCPDCRFIEPFMPELIKQFSLFNFYYVDRDECLEVCQELGVMGIPSFVAYSKGVEIERFVSRFRKSKEEIIDFLNTLERRGK